MKLAYLGNFGPPSSTENHVALSLESLGHEVRRVQEGEVRALEVFDQSTPCDLFLWTQTYGLAESGGDRADRTLMLETFRHFEIPTVGFHLDRWWGLGREDQVATEPFFRVDRLFTADGGHDDRWRAADVHHIWSPPAVFHGEAVDIAPRGGMRADVVFVGSWRSYGHEEWWPRRRELLERLRRRYRGRFACWPRGRAVRGLELNALYAGAKVIVGDSCLAGAPARYWSDRIPETLGRGGFLVHPHVDGLEEWHRDGEHLRTFELGDWLGLFALVDHYLEHDAEREAIRRAGAADVRARHTYRDRMRAVLAAMGLDREAVA